MPTKAKTKKGPTLQEVKDSLEAARASGNFNKSILLHLQGTYSFCEMDYEIVMKAFDEIANKVPFVVAGIDQFTAVEKVMFQLFVEHCNYGR